MDFKRVTKLESDVFCDFIRFNYQGLNIIEDILYKRFNISWEILHYTYYVQLFTHLKRIARKFCRGVMSRGANFVHCLFQVFLENCLFVTEPVLCLAKGIGSNGGWSISGNKNIKMNCIQ